MIQIKNVTFSYTADNPVLCDASLEINDGEPIILSGRNGAGKTTLAKLMNGLLLPGSGDVLIDGINTKEAVTLNKIRQKIAVLFSNPDNQIFSSTVDEDLAFGLENQCIEPEEMKKRIGLVIELMDIKHLRAIPVQFLSAGEKFKIVLAGILAMKPDYIVIDNPEITEQASGMDSIRELIEKSNNKKPSVVFMMHRLANIPKGFRVIKLEEKHFKILLWREKSISCKTI